MRAGGGRRRGGRERGESAMSLSSSMTVHLVQLALRASASLSNEGYARVEDLAMRRASCDRARERAREARCEMRAK